MLIQDCESSTSGWKKKLFSINSLSNATKQPKNLDKSILISRKWICFVHQLKQTNT